MPIALGESLNATIDKLLGSPTVTTIAKNPILTALVISFIIMLIIHRYLFFESLTYYLLYQVDFSLHPIFVNHI